MSELVKVNDNQIIALKHHDKNSTDLPKPFENEVYLLTTYISQSESIEEMNNIVEDFEDDEELALLRETNDDKDALINFDFDEYAIIVQRKDGKKLGYIPRHDNKVLARLMDAGKLLYGKVTSASKSYVDEPVSIDFDIYMKE